MENLAFIGRAAALAAGLVLGFAAAAGAEMSGLGDAGAGREVATGVCAECHWVVEDQAEPPDQGPSFFDLAKNPAYSPISLRLILIAPHLNMARLQLTRKQTDGVIDYILSLRR